MINDKKTESFHSPSARQLIFSSQELWKEEPNVKVEEFLGSKPLLSEFDTCIYHYHDFEKYINNFPQTYTVGSVLYESTRLKGALIQVMLNLCTSVSRDPKRSTASATGMITTKHQASRRQRKYMLATVSRTRRLEDRKIMSRYRYGEKDHIMEGLGSLLLEAVYLRKL